MFFFYNPLLEKLLYTYSIEQIQDRITSETIAYFIFITFRLFYFRFTNILPESIA